MAKDNVSNSDTAPVEQHQEATGTYGQMALGFFKSVGPAAVIGAFINGVSATPSPASQPDDLEISYAVGPSILVLGVFVAAGANCFFAHQKELKEWCKKYDENKNESSSTEKTPLAPDEENPSKKELPCPNSP